MFYKNLAFMTFHMANSMENHRINAGCALVVFKIMHPENVHTPNPSETVTLHGTFHMCRRHLEP